MFCPSILVTRSSFIFFFCIANDIDNLFFPFSFLLRLKQALRRFLVCSASFFLKKERSILIRHNKEVSTWKLAAFEQIFHSIIEMHRCASLSHPHRQNNHIDMRSVLPIPENISSHFGIVYEK